MLTLTQVWGALLILGLSPVLGALPLTGWMVRLVARPRLARARTQNFGLTAARYYGGAIAAGLALGIEASKGIGVVLLARTYFPADPVWEVMALMALVMGRYWRRQRAGVTSLSWGAIAHDPVTAALTLLVSLLGFTLFREKRQGRWLVLILFPLLTALRHSDGIRPVAVACLSALVAWSDQQWPVVAELPKASRVESQGLFGLFQRDRALLSLDRPLIAQQVGTKAALLSQLTRWGYPVPWGYALPAGDDPTLLIEMTDPSPRQPVVVRPSAPDGGTPRASGAGQYPALINLTSREALATAIAQCFSAYTHPTAIQYRRDRALPEDTLTVVVQQQVQSLCSGIAASRDPLMGTGDAVVIEARLGAADGLAAGRDTPERYRVFLQPDDLPDDLAEPNSWQLPKALSLTVEGSGDVPPRLLEQVAFLTRHIERRYQGLPLTLEWSFDGDRLWVLQSRPLLVLPVPRAMAPALSGAAVSPAAPLPSPLTLTGVPVSPGQVTGILRRLQPGHSPAAIAADTLLLVPHLDARQIPQLRGVRGVIAAAGGQLCNGALIAREYGIPTIVLATDLLPQLQEGQWGQLAAHSGTLTLW